LSEGPAVVHCQGGRDRTGLLVALVLDAAGVPRETIAADHALSDENFAPHNDAWFAEAATEEERQRRMRIAVPAGRTMIDVLDDVDRRWGGPAGYLGTNSLDTLVLRLRG
jgi:protein tyrosine/serine phosphatase